MSARPLRFVVSSRSRRGRGCGDHLLRVQDRDSLEPPKVRDVEGKDTADSVNHHGGYEAGVVGVLSADLILRDQLLPLGKEGRGLVKDLEKTLEAIQFLLRLERCKTKPILRQRPCGDHPEFVQALRRDAE